MITSAGMVRDVTGAELQHYQHYGFVRLKSVLATGEVERLRAAMRLALETFDASPLGCDLTALAETARKPGRTALPEDTQATAPFCPAPFRATLEKAGGAPLAERGASDAALGHYLIDCDVGRRARELREFALHSDLGRMAAGFLDAPAVRFYDDHLSIKEAGTRDRTAFHQDLSYMHINGDRGCCFWIFLDRVRSGSGALGYVPGSHRWGQVFKPNFLISDVACPGSEGMQLPGIDSSPDSFGVQYVDSDPGDIIAQSVLTLHGMQGNRGATASSAFAFSYVDSAIKMRRRPGLSISPSHIDAMREDEELDAEEHPVVWPEPRVAMAR